MTGKRGDKGKQAEKRSHSAARVRKPSKPVPATSDLVDLPDFEEHAPTIVVDDTTVSDVAALIADARPKGPCRWSVTFGSHDALLRGNPTSTSPASLDEFSKEALGQYLAARDFAEQVLSEGHLGTNDVVVHLSGHANPGHVPQAGQPNDAVSVAINQKAR